MRVRIPLYDLDQLALFGQRDMNLKALDERFDAKIVARGSEVIIKGEDGEVKRLRDIFAHLVERVRKGQKITVQEITHLIDLSSDGKALGKLESEAPLLSSTKTVVRARTSGQRRYVKAMKKNDIVIGIGPAGTGKTYLAVAMALSAFENGIIGKIVLTRPAVEAGETLGYLPGDYVEKVDPYLRPLHDALYEMLPFEKVRKLMGKHAIEVAPLAYMRGRTLNDAYVILDEAQNTTRMQMKMFLTRLGPNSKAVVTGDITQIDLPGNDHSGLVEIQRILRNVQGIEFIYLTEKDVVRHHLVQKIIQAYEKNQK
jgi:phosphate starvation-inducible PhoH-like protein